VIDGKTGFLANNTIEWQEYLANLIEDQHLRQEMGSAGRRRVEKRFSIYAALPILIKVLNKAASG
jgi:glycosyltransferase involved in cell wall biosynthesis